MMGTCNFETYGNASLNWFSKKIAARYWPYAEKMVDANEGASEEKEAEANPDDWQLLMKTNNLKKDKKDKKEKEEKEEEPKGPNMQTKCLQASDLPTTMRTGDKLKASQGNCGFKIQVSNTSDKVAFTVFLVRDGGISLAAFAAPFIFMSAAIMCIF